MKYSMLFTDIDGTLLFSGGNKGKDFYHIDRDNYISSGTLKKLEEIKSRVSVICATSRRLNSYLRFEKYFLPETAILEDGTLIRDTNGEYDIEWLDSFRDVVGPPECLFENRRSKCILWDFYRKLKARNQGKEVPNFKISDDGYIAAFLLSVSKEIPMKNYLDVSAVLKALKITVPPELSCSLNAKYNSLIVKPAQVNKKQAALYLTDKMGIDLANCAACGDDFNDYDLISSVGGRFTHSGAVGGIQSLVSEKSDGYLSPYSGFEGIEDMLTAIIES